jgi:hypothetical protein
MLYCLLILGSVDAASVIALASPDTSGRRDRVALADDGWRRARDGQRRAVRVDDQPESSSPATRF